MGFSNGSDSPQIAAYLLPQWRRWCSFQVAADSSRMTFWLYVEFLSDCTERLLRLQQIILDANDGSSCCPNYLLSTADVFLWLQPIVFPVASVYSLMSSWLQHAVFLVSAACILNCSKIGDHTSAERLYTMLDFCTFNFKCIVFHAGYVQMCILIYPTS